MGQHKVAKAIKEKHVIKFQKFDSPKSQKLTLIINGLRSLPRPYGMVLIDFPLSFSGVIPVTTSTAVVLKASAPALVPPVGAARFAVKVVPAGMATPIDAVIFLVLSLVVMA